MKGENEKVAVVVKDHKAGKKKKTQGQATDERSTAQQDEESLLLVARLISDVVA
jgi:hypothetical protein